MVPRRGASFSLMIDFSDWDEVVVKFQEMGDRDFSSISEEGMPDPGEELKPLDFEAGRIDEHLPQPIHSTLVAVTGVHAISSRSSTSLEFWAVRAAVQSFKQAAEQDAAWATVRPATQSDAQSASLDAPEDAAAQPAAQAAA